MGCTDIGNRLVGLRWAQKKWDSMLRSSFWRRKRAGAGGGPPRSLAMKSFMVLRFTPRRRRAKPAIKILTDMRNAILPEVSLHSAPPAPPSGS